MTEDELLRNVLDLCRLLRIRTAHFRPARTERGWRTAVAGDGAGFPDLVLAAPGGLLFRELKSARGVVEPEQWRWMEVLRAAGADAEVWRPADWTSGRVQAQLDAIRKVAA